MKEKLIALVLWLEKTFRPRYYIRSKMYYLDNNIIYFVFDRMNEELIAIYATKDKAVNLINHENDIWYSGRKGNGSNSKKST